MDAAGPVMDLVGWANHNNWGKRSPPSSLLQPMISAVTETRLYLVCGVLRALR
jgi:hypothetical protein